MGEALYSTAEACALLKRGASLVTHLARTNGIGRKVGRGWVFTNQDLSALREHIGGRNKFPNGNKLWRLRRRHGRKPKQSA